MNVENFDLPSKDTFYVRKLQPLTEEILPVHMNIFVL